MTRAARRFALPALHFVVAVVVVAAALAAVPLFNAQRGGWAIDALLWSAGALVVQLVFLATAWYLLLKVTWSHGATVSLGVRSFAFGWLSRYLPGPPTGPAGKFLVCRDAGMPGGALTTALWLEQALQLAVAIALPSATLAFAFGPRALPLSFGGMAAAALIGYTATHPAVVRRFAALARILRLSNDEPVARVSFAVAARVAGTLLGGALFGAISFHFAAVTISTWPLASVGPAVFIFSLASLAGFVVPFAPSGAGVREAVIVGLMGATLGGPEALSVAIVARAVAIGIDVLLALLLLGGGIAGAAYRALGRDFQSSKNRA